MSGDMALIPNSGRLCTTTTAAPRCAVSSYKFMENAAKLIKVVKGSRLDVESFIPCGSLWMRCARWPLRCGRARPSGRFAVRRPGQTISKSLADDSRPGVSAEGRARSAKRRGQREVGQVDRGG